MKNTGRCRELLVPNATVILEDHGENARRKTRYDLIAVYKGGTLINMDSQAPNKAVGEFLPLLFGENAAVRPETPFGGSRLDFYVRSGQREIFAEVKGVTLETDGVCMFPDAPTERGVKHLHELMNCVDRGFEAYAVFVIQMNRAKYFTANYGTHPLFGETLKAAREKGVRLLAYTCKVTENSMEIADPLDIIL